jgi:hypothetical protein
MLLQRRFMHDAEQAKKYQHQLRFPDGGESEEFFLSPPLVSLQRSISASTPVIKPRFKPLGVLKLKRACLLIIPLLTAIHIYAQTPPREGTGYIPVENINTLPGQSGYIDTSGRFILMQTFESAGSFSEGLADVKFVGSKWGYIDSTGKMVIQPQFDETGSFSEGLAAVKEGCKWGYIDKSGKLVIPFLFDEADHFSDGLAVVEVGEKSGYIDKTGKFVVPLRTHRFLWQFSEGIARLEVTAEHSTTVWGYINKTGEVAIKAQYHHAGDFSEGLASVSKDGWWHSQTSEWVDVKYGYIDKFGKTIIPFIFDYVSSFSGGLASVVFKGKAGVIDKNGKYVIEPQFYSVGHFSEDLAPVQLAAMGKYGYIDRTGRIAIQPQWQCRQFLQWPGARTCRPC